MRDDGISIDLEKYFDMQYAGDSVALSPLPVARQSPSGSCQQGFVTEGYHITDVEMLYGLSPMSLGDFGESDLAGWTRLNLVANLPWFRLIDLMCTLLNYHRGRKSANKWFLRKHHPILFFTSGKPQVRIFLPDLGCPPQPEGQKTGY
jgi:hypothetical protein